MSVKARSSMSKKERQRRKEARRRDEDFQRALAVIKEKDPEQYERILREQAWNEPLSYRSESELAALRPKSPFALPKMKSYRTFSDEAKKAFVGSQKPRRVVQTFQRVADGIYCLYFENEITHNISEIRATGNHPFYVIDKGWIANELIEIGDSCLSKKGDAMILVRREYIRGKINVYNIEVEEAHTYFVGENPDDCIWAHNKCGPDEVAPPSASKIPDAKWKFENAKEILKDLRGNIEIMPKLMAQLQWMFEQGLIFEANSLVAQHKVGKDWIKVPIYDGYQKKDGRLYVLRKFGDVGAALMLAHEGMHALGKNEEQAYLLQMQLLVKALQSQKYMDEAKELAKWAIEQGMLTVKDENGEKIYTVNTDGIKKFLETAPEYNWKNDGLKWDLVNENERKIHPQIPFRVKPSK